MLSTSNSPEDANNRIYSGTRVGYYGKNDFSKAMAKMLLDAGIDLAFQITWSKEDCDGPVPKAPEPPSSSLLEPPWSQSAG